MRRENRQFSTTYAASSLAEKKKKQNTERTNERASEWKKKSTEDAKIVGMFWKVWVVREQQPNDAISQMLFRPKTSVIVEYC